MVNAWRHESLFFYNVTRAYPFRWFTPTVVIATIVLMAIFTLINLITQGFQIVTVSTTDPSELVGAWERSLPRFLTTRIRPTCSPVQIPVGSTIYSNKKGLSYKLNAVTQRVANAQWDVQSALTYSNDVIQNCTVTALSVSLNGRTRSPQERAWMEWGPQARAFIQCDIRIVQDPIFQSTLASPLQTARINLTTIYDYIPEDIAYGPWRVSDSGLETNPNSNGLSSLVVENAQQSPSLFWAASMLSMYWAQTSARMTNETERMVSQGGRNGSNSVLSSGIVYFRRNLNVNDIKDLGYFDIDFRMFYDQTNNGDMDVDFANSSSSIASLASSNHGPNIWIPADSLAKSLWSTIMADLGDVQQSQIIVNDAGLTTHFTQNFTQIIGELNHTRFASARPGPSQQDFASASGQIKDLFVNRSVVDTQYLCQQPQWRNGGEIFILVLAQNLVFLGSVWRAWTLLVGWLFLRQDKMGRDINYCEGHIDDHRARSTGLMQQQPQGEGAPGLLSRRWHRQEEGTYNNETGPVYRAVPDSASPPPLVSRYSKDFKSATQVAETQK